jgi:hypothetical protein
MLTKHLERTPRRSTNTGDTVGLLRLRECFALRSTPFAQDDKTRDFVGVWSHIEQTQARQAVFFQKAFVDVLFL